MRLHAKLLRLVLGVVAIAAFATIGSGSASAKPGNGPSHPSSSGCPSFNAYEHFDVLHNASTEIRETEPGTFEYLFAAAMREEEAAGVPGLIRYCVYPPSAPDRVEAKFDAWVARQSGHSPDFSFGRPRGNSTNVPLNGETALLGTATWEGEAPTVEEQRILIHVNDREACSRLYRGDGSTCFVRPVEVEEPSVACDEGAGSDEFAYNAFPFGFNKGCPGPPSLGFEATGTSEFGDEVGLAGSGGHISLISVDFQSYGCGVSGHWNTGDCVTSPGEEFSVPGGITLHVYEAPSPGEPFPDTVGPQIGETTYTGGIPYRPSADTEHCDATGKWFESVSEECINSLSVPISFEFEGEGVAVPANRAIIWTVSFNTTNTGYSPIGANPSCPAAGCGYDSLNVGAMSYAEEAFSGTDVNPDGVFINQTSTPSNLGEEGGWTGFRPLALVRTE